MLSPTLGMQQIEGTLHDSKAGEWVTGTSGIKVLAARDDVARVAHTAYVSAVAEVTRLWRFRELCSFTAASVFDHTLCDPQFVWLA